MNDRLTRNAPGVVKAMGDTQPADAYDPGNPTVGVELHKTNGLLLRANEVAETLLSKIRGAVPEDGDKGKAVCVCLLTDACNNRELAGDLCARLDELARLLG